MRFIMFIFNGFFARKAVTASLKILYASFSVCAKRKKIISPLISCVSFRIIAPIYIKAPLKR